MAVSLRIILEGKFGALPKQLLDLINNATDEQLRQWMSRVFAAESLNDLFPSE
jgi:hypothetical protein